MKTSMFVAAAAAGVASAQMMSGSNSMSATYVPPSKTATLTNGADPTLTGPGGLPLPIVTGTTTFTYCPACEHLTTYVTDYSVFCPTGMAPATYTITETCTGSVPSFTPHTPGYIPSGFTTGVETCHYCGPTPITATVTYPSAGPSPYIPPGSSTPLPCPGAGCPGVPAGMSPPVAYLPCPGGPSCPATGAPAPAPAPAVCPGGPNCPASAPAPAPAPALTPSNMTFIPYTGGAPANTLHLAGIFTGVVGVGLLATLL